MYSMGERETESLFPPPQEKDFQELVQFLQALPTGALCVWCGGASMCGVCVCVRVCGVSVRACVSVWTCGHAQYAWMGGMNCDVCGGMTE